MNGVVVRETIRRHVTHPAFVIYLLLLTLIGFGVARFNAAGSVWPTFVTLLAIIAGCGVIGPEFSSGTLQLILVKPVNRAVYLLSRVAGVVAVVWIAIVVAFGAEALGHLVWPNRIPWPVLLNSVADAILTVSLLTLLGSLTRAYFNVAIYVAGMMTLSMASGILGLSRRVPQWLLQALSTIDANLYPEMPPRFDRNWLLLVLSNASIALLLACLAFRRREVPYGAD